MDAREQLRRGAMKPLVSDLDYYAEAYRAYAGFAAHKLELYQKWGDEIFVPQVVDKLQRSFKGIKEFRVLGIGSGGGEMDVCVLEPLCSMFHSISNVVIEPSSDAIAKYKTLLKEKAVSLQGIKTYFKQTTIQEYCMEMKKIPPDSSRPKFHFIHAIQSLYYTDDLKGTIKDMYEMLEIDGAMLIMMMTDEHVIYKMWDNFPLLMREQAVPSITNLSGNDITKTLQQLRLDYTLHTVHCRTDGSLCFDPKSDKGNKILDFLTNTIRFRDTAPIELCDEVLTFLRAICLSSSSSLSPSSSLSTSSSSLPVSRNETEDQVVEGEEKKTEDKLIFSRDSQSSIVFRQDSL